MPPLRFWFVLLGTLLGSFANGVATMLTQAMSTGIEVHRYAWYTAAAIAVSAMLGAAKLAWPTTPARPRRRKRRVIRQVEEPPPADMA